MPVSYEEWLEMPETKTVEVTDGEIRAMPRLVWSHAEILDNLNGEISKRVSDREVAVASSPFDLVIRRQPLTTRIPDLAVFQVATIVERDGLIFSPPQLVAEVRTTSVRGRQEKLADFASMGVPEVWAILPEDRTVEVLYLEDGGYVRHALLTEGFLKPKCFPSVEVPISEIWPA